MQLHFLGAADTVTGSRHRVDLGGQRLLLDAGLFQGYKVLRERNWARPAPALLDVDTVVLSHAHLDHSGYLPALVKHGFRGRIVASPATCALAEVLLMDSAHLQEEDARRANRYGYSRHEKALPLYTKADVQKAMAQFMPLAPGKALVLGGSGRGSRPGSGGVQLRLQPAGHLLGACSVALDAGSDGRLLFSGDLGRPDDLLMRPPAAPPAADVLLVESTYGNRLHTPEDVAARLADTITQTIARGGKLLLPAFAVGRAQALLLVLQRLKRQGRIPADLPVFVDSPMAVRATALYRQFARELRVKPGEMKHLVDGVRMVETPQQSARLVASNWPSVVVSASGMATGGRVLHHLKALLPDARHTVVFPGFQVGGSRGAKLVAGEREVKIHGEFVPVRAAIGHLEGFSGHADADGLMHWLGQLPQAPRQTFVVHGEAAAADTLRSRIARELGWAVRVPQQGEQTSA